MYASVWKRFFAFLIDAAVFAVLFWALAQVMDNVSLSVVLLVLVWLYYALLESSPVQASLGKIIMGIKVVDRRGRRLSFWQATERILSKLITNITFYFGFFIAAFDRQKQTLHDRISHSAVILKNAQFNPDDFAEEEEVPLTLITITSILLALAFVSCLVMWVTLPQYARLADRVQLTRMEGVLEQAFDHHQLRVEANKTQPHVWLDPRPECHPVSPETLACPGYDLQLTETGVELNVRTQGMDILYTLFKPYDGGPVTCTSVTKDGLHICQHFGK